MDGVGEGRAGFMDNKKPTSLERVGQIFKV